MEGIGAEVSQKIRSAIKAKLMEIGVYVDEELPDYVMVMVANKRSKDQMDDDLQLFLGKHTSLFTSWLHQVLQKLQEVTVANLGGAKRKLSEEPKKKKKSKQDTEKKEVGLKKKIKLEPEDDKDSSKIKADSKEKKDGTSDEHCNKNQCHETESRRKEKTDLRTVTEQTKESKVTSKTSKNIEESSSNSENRQKSDDGHKATRSKSHSASSSPVEDLDDEDCINIRTDGELLDTADDVNAEEPSGSTKGIEDSVTLKISSDINADKKSTAPRSKSPIRHKDKSKYGDSNNRATQKLASKKQPSPPKSPSHTNDKVIDARELLNRKKAAKQSDNRGKSRSKDRSVSPPRKKRDEDRETRVFRENRNANKKMMREDERELSRRVSSRDDERDRRATRDRDSHTSKRRGENRPSRKTDSDRIDSRDSRRRDSSNEPPPKRVMLERPFRNKNDDWDVSRSSRVGNMSEGRKVEIDSPVKRKDLEELRKRSGIVSRVVPRAQEPEEDVEIPVPSVVKVTPRPRRPPSQQPSSTLIMKAISEANKSLAGVPQRPDSTQRSRKDPVFTRTLRQLQRIPPEKIAVSITNPLALQNVNNMEVKEDHDKRSVSPEHEKENNRSPLNNAAEVTSSEPDNSGQNENHANNEWKKKEKVHGQSQQEVHEESELQEQPPQELETYEEPLDEMSDPQFVVTLNGYDPDGLYSQSELDINEEGEIDDWLKENVDEEPLLTSTPDVASPQPKRERNTSPVVIMNTPAVNHANLIEVELVKSKNTERCKYWPACRLGDKCTYYHPSKPCKLFPACKFGDACLYIHPQCKFNALCTRKDCVFAHTPAYTPTQPAALPKAKALYASSAPMPCKFYPNCANVNCQFAHPPRACRFGLYCTKKDCSFHHGQIAPVDKLKWTRVTTT